MKSSFRLKGLVYLSLVGVLSVGSAYACGKSGSDGCSVGCTGRC